MSDELKAAQEELAAAVEKVSRLLGAVGVMGEWTAVVAFQDYEDEDSSTQIIRLFPDGVPYHRSLGLLDYALVRMRHNIGRLDSDSDD